MPIREGYLSYRPFNGNVHNFWGNRTYEYEQYLEKQEIFNWALETIWSYLCDLEKETPGLRGTIYQIPEYDTARYIGVRLQIENRAVQTIYSVYELEETGIFDYIGFGIRCLYERLK